MIPLAPWEPDKGPFAGESIDTVVNLLPLSNGWGPMPSLSEVSSSLGAECKGAVLYRNTSGATAFVAATQTALWKMTSVMGWEDVSRTVGGAYTGPSAGDFWQFEIHGIYLYATNLNDALQRLDIDAGTDFVVAPGSPPQAKFIRSIGDFLFLAHLKVGATTYPRKWHHSAINDATDWAISGSVGDSDDQEIPDGGDIVGIVPIEGGNARILQRNARHLLQFTPGSAVSFQQADMDYSHGAVAPYAIVVLGPGQYFYLNETGFYLNDNYLPIGAEKVDKYFLADVDPEKLSKVQAAADPVRKIIWVRYQNQSGTYKTIGYNWRLERWFPSDIPVMVLVSSATPGMVVDDFTGTVDSYTDTVDSAEWNGSDNAIFGAFKADNKLHLFTGPAAAATIETSTVEVIPERYALVTGSTVKGNMSGVTVQVGKAVHPSDALTWSAASERHARTGLYPARVNGKFHRVRVNIAAGAAGTHLHGVNPAFVDAGGA